MIKMIAENYVKFDLDENPTSIDFLLYIGLDGNVERVFKYLNRI